MENAIPKPDSIADTQDWAGGKLPRLPQLARHMANHKIEQGLMVFIGTVAAMLFTLGLLGDVHHEVLLWPISGAALGLSLPFWSKRWQSRVALQAAAVLGAFAGGLLVGMPLTFCVSVAALTGLDLVLAGCILSPHVQSLDDLKTQGNLKRFMLAIAACPLLTGLLGATPVSHTFGSLSFKTVVTVIFANSLGFAVVLPLTLSLVNWPGSKLRFLARHTRRAALLYCGIFLVCASATFYQNTGPFLFCIFPAMMPVLLTLGLEGAILISVAVTVIGSVATAHGHGPILLMRDASSRDRLIALQLFDWICLITALPIGALLDDRRKAHQTAENAQSITHGFQHFNPNITYIKDAEGRYVSYNAALAEFFGITSTAWVGCCSYDLHSPATAASFRKQDQQILENGTDIDVCEQVRGCDGHVALLRHLKFPIISANGTRFIGGIAVDITAEIENQRALADANERLEQMARIDTLTGLSRRHVFEDRITIEFHAARRNGRPLSLLFIDLDNFKKRNDQFGHEAGDEALRLFGSLLARSARASDLPARYGGEEFVLLLPETAIGEAGTVAARLLSALRSCDAGPLPLTASIGCASLRAETLNWQHLVARADEAMYEAKTTGKDRFVAEPTLAQRLSKLGAQALDPETWVSIREP